jgi:hypothetical protein
MAAAIALIVAGFTLVYSALKGLSLTDVLSGATGSVLDPAGGKGATGKVNVNPPDAGEGSTPASGGDPKGKFKGPHAGTLRMLADNATQNFNLTITQICRPASANYGSPTSLHKECRAFDAIGTTANKVAFARWAKPILDKIGGEVFCDQAGMIAPGYEHRSHVHAGA